MIRFTGRIGRLRIGGLLWRGKETRISFASFASFQSAWTWSVGIGHDVEDDVGDDMGEHS